jgi:hypothetical protein
MGRALRSELQGEVARLQQALELSHSELEMVRREKDGAVGSFVQAVESDGEQRMELAAALRAAETQVCITTFL